MTNPHDKNENSFGEDFKKTVLKPTISLIKWTFILFGLFVLFAIFTGG